MTSGLRKQASITVYTRVIASDRKGHRRWELSYASVENMHYTPSTTHCSQLVSYQNQLFRVNLFLSIFPTTTCLLDPLVCPAPVDQLLPGFSLTAFQTIVKRASLSSTHLLSSYNPTFSHNAAFVERETYLTPGLQKRKWRRHLNNYSGAVEQISSQENFQ